VDVHRPHAGGGGAQDRDGQLHDRVALGVITKGRCAGTLHRKQDIAGVFDGGRKCAVLFGVLRGVVEADVEGDHAGVQRLERPKQLGVDRARKWVAVLVDGSVVERDDGHLIRERGVPDVDRLVVDDRLKRRVEEIRP